jgi:hypothetical protein
MTDISGGYIVRESLRSRFGALFIALLAAIVVPPMLPPGRTLSFLFALFITGVLFSGLYAVSKEKRHLLIGVLLVIPAVTLNWWNEFTPTPAAEFISSTLTAVFLFYLGWLIFLHILTSRRVDTDLVYAAICIYLLLGYTCGTIFYLIELATPGPAVLAGTADTILRESEAVYYSFVTLTTLGYGDIVPKHEMARALAMLEAVTGQLFLAVLLARLVALHTTRTGKTDTESLLDN